MHTEASQPFGGAASLQPWIASGDRLSGTALGRILLGICIFFGGFVIIEPAPYELFMVALLGLFVISGLRFGPHAILLLLLFTTYTIGGIISMQLMPDATSITMYLMVTLFLGVSAAFWCAVVERDPYLLRIIMRMWAIAGAISSLLGIAGYFGVHTAFRIFTLYDRAKGAFQDPNVFAPFLVVPTLYLIYGIIARRDQLLLFRIGLLGILLAGLFLAFSRGAWGVAVVSGAIFYGLLIVTAPTVRQRLRLIMVAVFGVAALVAMLIVALQFEAVSGMFEERARLLQDYDAHRGGRFGRHAVGFLLALERPFGIGPLQFGLEHGEDTHNIWLKSLMAYGWIGFISWLSMTVITLFGGMRLLGRARPWQPFLLILWSTFVGHNILGMVIDLDHWRHYFLIVGLIWGIMALEAAHQRDLARR